MVFKNFGGSKFWIFEILDILKKIPLITILIYKAKLKNASPICHNLLRNDQNEFLLKIQNC